MNRRILLIVAILSAGCAATPMTPQQVVQGPMGFLKEGQTTREQILLRLGSPYAGFEKERILTYRLSEDGKPVEEYRGMDSASAADDPTLVAYHLVLVFTPGNVLERFSLVPMVRRHVPQ